MNIKPICLHCGNDDVRKHGMARSKIQRYICLHCHKTFQKRYIYRCYVENSQELAKSN
ncbi:transposase [Budvicia aquatica]|uniref:transposase n=1 Tax=Budvicia aquatica TaxID=82979 RepID=UPI003D157C7C